MREAAEGKPVKIGLLQRYATDVAMARGRAVLRRAPRRPASASPSSAPARPASPARTASRCTATTSTMFDARPKPGGLNEYGIAAYKTPDDFAQARGRLHPRHRRHRPSRPARRSAATSRSPTCTRELRRGVPRHGPRRRQRAAAPRARTPTASTTRSTSSPTLRQAERPRGAAGRPPRRGDRRRHDRDRRRGAGQAPRRRGGDHRLPPRPGADERLRATSRSWPQPRASRSATGSRRSACSPTDGKVTGIELELHGARCDGTLAGDRRNRRRSPADLVFKAIGQTLCRPTAKASRSPAARSRSMPRAAPRCRASGPAATASPAART